MDINEINAALAADLVLLSEALDESGDAIADSVGRLAADAQLAVPSYLGVCVLSNDDPPRILVAVFADEAIPRASIVIPMAHFGRADDPASLSVILYAGQPGAFVDMAADLAWLSGLTVDAFAVDQHLLPADLSVDGAYTVTSVSNEAVINQALGVLFSRGMTPQQAHVELDNRAAASGIDRLAAAEMLLDEV